MTRGQIMEFALIGMAFVLGLAPEHWMPWNWGKRPDRDCDPDVEPDKVIRADDWTDEDEL